MEETLNALLDKKRMSWSMQKNMKALSTARANVPAIINLTYMDFSTQHWARIRTNNTIERLNREIKRRTKAIGACQIALMLVCARLRHVAATSWGTRRYLNMDHFLKTEDALLSDTISG